METVEITLPSGEITTNAVLMSYAVNGSAYCALIMLQDNGEPYPIDAVLYAVEKDKDGDYKLYEIEDENEYDAAARAFDLLQKRL